MCGLAAAPLGIVISCALVQVAFDPFAIMPSTSPATFVYVPIAVQLFAEAHVASLRTALG